MFIALEFRYKQINLQVLGYRSFTSKVWSCQLPPSSPTNLSILTHTDTQINANLSSCFWEYCRQNTHAKSWNEIRKWSQERSDTFELRGHWPGIKKAYQNVTGQGWLIHDKAPKTTSWGLVILNTVFIWNLSRNDSRIYITIV